MALELSGITHRYGRHIALKDIDLTVHPGDCYGFIGHNGAGKTTALRIALGLAPLQRGEVLVDGQALRRDPVAARARMGGLVETPGFFGSWDGARNLFQLARLQGMARRAARTEAGALLEMVGLAHAGGKRVRAYSQGMRQRLGIAQALIGRPPYLLLDEPTNGLDPEGIADLRALVRRLTREERHTVVLSSHQLHEIAGLCNRIGVLKEGVLLAEESAEALLGGATGRFAVRAANAGAAARVLEGLGLAPVEAGGELLVDLDGRRPADVSRALVEAGCELESFARHGATLEEIYLRMQAPAPRPPPSRTRAPRNRAVWTGWPGATWRALRYDTVRLARGGAGAALLLLPAAVGAAAVWQRKVDADAAAREMAEGGLASTTVVTAFEGVAFGLAAALPLAAAVLCGVASQSLAGELGRGTLRNALLRPLRRTHLAAGKMLALAGAAMLGYALLLAAVLGASAAAFDFTAVYEILPNGARYEYLPERALWEALFDALPAAAPPLIAYAALGFVAGGVARGGAAALGLALGGFVAVDLGRAVARGWHVETWLPAAHLPSPLGDTSFLRRYGDVVQGISNVAAAPSPWPLAWWIAGGFLLAAWILSRRTVP